MKKSLLAIAAAVAALTAGSAFAQSFDGSSPWLVRLRAVHVDPSDGGSLSSKSGVGMSVSSKTIPEVDISYFFTPNIAAELILTYPQKHDIRSNGAIFGPLGKIGSLKELPPTLTAQYHFTDLGAIKPYVGAGINFTNFSSVKINSGVDDVLGGVYVKNNSWGAALQIGVDYAIDKNWSVNLDVKKVYMKTDVKSRSGIAILGIPAGKLGDYKVDPLLVGVGVGYRF